MDVERGSVDVCGAALAYEVAGSGHAIVLIHAGLADRRMFDDLVPALAPFARVVRYDMHGFGESGSPAGAYSHHDALRGLLAGLGIGRASVLGVSLGANVALDFELTHPALVDRLVLVATGLDGYPPGAETAALAAPVAEAFRAGDFVRAIDLSIRLWVDGPRRVPDEVDPAVRELVRALYTDVLRRSREGGRPADRLAPPAIERLAEVKAPTLVVVGVGDLPDIVAEADLLASTIPGARLATIPVVGHMLVMERPVELARLALEFSAPLR